MGSPVPVVATPSPVRSASMSVVTMTVVAAPPWIGSRAGSQCSSRLQNARPSRTSYGARSWPALMRLTGWRGEANASR